MATKEEKMEAFGHLLDILDELRVKCPWDRKQTNESLRTNTIEETYELCDAIMKNDNANIKKELGDLLLHIVFYAKIGEEKKAFDIKDVCDSLCQKLIYRHPHVFGNADADTPQKVEQSWEQLKLKEKGGNKTVLEGVPSALPSIVKAQRIQDKARNVGFDWEQREQVWDKVQEEFTELKTEIEKMDADRMEAEFGDLFFELAAFLIDGGTGIFLPREHFFVEVFGQVIVAQQGVYFDISDRQVSREVDRLNLCVVLRGGRCRGLLLATRRAEEYSGDGRR